jgi:kexin
MAPFSSHVLLFASFAVSVSIGVAAIPDARTIQTARDASSLSRTLLNSAPEHRAMNVTSVWQQGITGRKSTVCVVGDGVDMLYPGLRTSYAPYGSKNFVRPGPDPMPDAGAHGGTYSALEISGDGTGACPVGVAYGSKVTGLKVITSEKQYDHEPQIISDLELARALNHEMDLNHVYTCSWVLSAPELQEIPGLGLFVRRALANGAQRGRGGRGSVYVFNADNNAHGGYHDSIHAISVGSIDHQDNPTVKGKINAAQMIVSYGSDISAVSNRCGLHSASATSFISGVIALALEVNPELSARDIQWLMIVSSTKIDNPAIRDWQMNTEMHKPFSHEVGYGKLDVPAFVQGAKRWKSVGTLASEKTAWLHVDMKVPHHGDVLTTEHELIQIDTDFYDVNVIEQVVLTVELKGEVFHEDLMIELESPIGMVSHFVPYATVRNVDGVMDMTFMSVAHWAESPIGKWRLKISHRSEAAVSNTAELFQWRLTFYGLPADGRHDVYWPLRNDPFGPYLEDMEPILSLLHVGGSKHGAATNHNATSIAESSDSTGTEQHHMSPYRGLISVFAAVLLAFVIILGGVLRFLKYRDACRAKDTRSYFALEEDSDSEEYNKDAKTLPERSLEV